MKDEERIRRLVSVDAEYNPTPLARRAVLDAIEDFDIHRTLGGALPCSGGYDEQPAEWVEATLCVKAAYENARYDLERREQEEAESQSRRRRVISAG